MAPFKLSVIGKRVGFGSFSASSFISQTDASSPGVPSNVAFRSLCTVSLFRKMILGCVSLCVCVLLYSGSQQPLVLISNFSLLEISRALHPKGSGGLWVRIISAKTKNPGTCV